MWVSDIIPNRSAKKMLLIREIDLMLDLPPALASPVRFKAGFKAHIIFLKLDLPLFICVIYFVRLFVFLWDGSLRCVE